MTWVEQRAAARIAWRYARKAKARTALILFLIALPIGALVGTGIIINTVVKNPADNVTRDMGSADLMLFITPSGPAYDQMGKLLPRGSVINEVKGLTAYKVSGGTLYTLLVTENSVPSDRPPSAAQYKLSSGHMPHRAGEAVMSSDLAGHLGIRIGDNLQLDGLKRSVTLVGLAWNRFDLRDTGVVVGRGTLDSNQGDSVPALFVVLPRGANLRTVEDTLIRSQAGFQDRARVLSGNLRDQTRITGFSFAGAIVALFATGMIVVTAFGVGARRQLRAHGLIEATGGEPRHVRAIVLWGGIWLGAIGSIVGVLVALVAALILRPHVNGLANRIVEGIRIPWLEIIGGIVLGTLAATFAALAPARQAAQVSAVDALAGRSPNPRPPGRLARRGAVGVLVGCAFTVIATITHEWTLLGIALVVTLTGFLFTIPLLVTFVGRLATRLPPVPRLAARQTARYGRRTGAAVAAATIALIVPIALSSMILSNDATTSSQGPLSRDQMLISYYRDSQDQVPPNVTDAARSAVSESIVAGIRFADSHLKQEPGFAPGQDEAPVNVTGPPLPPVRAAVGVVAPAFPLAVADPALMRAAHAEAGIPYITGDRLIAVGLPTDNGILHLEFQGAIGPYASSINPDGSAPVQVGPPPIDRIDVRAISVSGGSGDPSQIPHYFIPSKLLSKFGLHSSRVSVALLRATHPLSKAEIAHVKHIIGLIPGGIAIGPHDYVIDSTGVRLAITGAAIGLALIIVAVAVALVGAESRREQAILSAVGATPGIRRRMVGANAFMMTALASILSLPAALIPITLILHARHRFAPTPWSTVGIVVLGAPLVAGLIAALASRAPKARVMLQPNW